MPSYEKGPLRKEPDGSWVAVEPRDGRNYRYIAGDVSVSTKVINVRRSSQWQDATAWPLFVPSSGETRPQELRRFVLGDLELLAPPLFGFGFLRDAGATPVETPVSVSIYPAREGEERHVLRCDPVRFFLAIEPERFEWLWRELGDRPGAFLEPDGEATVYGINLRVEDPEPAHPDDTTKPTAWTVTRYLQWLLGVVILIAVIVATKLR